MAMDSVYFSKFNEFESTADNNSNENTMTSWIKDNIIILNGYLEIAMTIAQITIKYINLSAMLSLFQH